MIDTALAQLRYVASAALGAPFNPRSLDRLVDGLLATRREFGALDAQARKAAGSPEVDAASLRELQLRRFRTQAQRGAAETGYYSRLFTQIALDPRRLASDDIARIPPTRKEDVRADAGDFVRRSARPAYRTLTTGTTGKPTSMVFSDDEMRTYIALAALSLLLTGVIGPEDVVQVSTSARAVLGNTQFMGACTRVGALVYQTGIVEPEQALALLAERHALPGKKPQASVLNTYPSYLGRLLETGLRLGYTPADFGLERIILGGEIVTEGVKRRCQALFGPVQFSEGYGMTEPWPFGGTLCEQGHLHFEPTHGLMEVQALDEERPAGPGEAGTLLLTPFAPYRQSIVLLRYDSEDVVRAVAGPPDCSLRHLPASGMLLGKRRLSLRHDQGWTFPRDVLEAVEAVDAVPLPARCSFRAAPGGVAVDVVVSDDSPAVQRQIEDSLLRHGVPVQQLTLLRDPSLLPAPLPWRGDLHEASF